jgi:hypothetical protein
MAHYFNSGLRSCLFNPVCGYFSGGDRTLSHFFQLWSSMAQTDFRLFFVWCFLHIILDRQYRPQSFADWARYGTTSEKQYRHWKYRGVLWGVLCDWLLIERKPALAFFSSLFCQYLH